MLHVHPDYNVTVNDIKYSFVNRPFRKLTTGPSAVYSPNVCMSFPFNLDL